MKLFSVLFLLLVVACNNKSEKQPLFASSSPSYNGEGIAFESFFMEVARIYSSDSSAIELLDISDIAPLGNSYVIAHKTTSELLLFDKENTLTNRWGRQGRGPGEFNSLEKVYTLADTIFALDGMMGYKAHYFDLNGNLLKSFHIPSAGPFQNEYFLQESSGYYAALNTFGRCSDDASANCLILLLDSAWNIKKAIAPVKIVEPDFYVASFKSAFDGSLFYVINVSGSKISAFDLKGNKVKEFDFGKIYPELKPLDYNKIDRQDPIKTMQFLNTEELTLVSFFHYINEELLIQVTLKNIGESSIPGTMPLVFFNTDGTLHKIVHSNDKRLLKIDSMGYYYFISQTKSGEISLSKYIPR